MELGEDSYELIASVLSVYDEPITIPAIMDILTFIPQIDSGYSLIIGLGIMILNSDRYSCSGEIEPVTHLINYQSDSPDVSEHKWIYIIEIMWETITSRLDDIYDNDEDPAACVLRGCTLNIVTAHAVTMAMIAMKKVPYDEDCFPKLRKYDKFDRYVILPLMDLYRLLYQDILQALSGLSEPI